MHRRNTAEMDIGKFKDNFISGLCAKDPDFLKQNWDRLLEQEEITLNLLRTSGLNPRLLAYMHLKSEFNFNRTPMDPLVPKTLVHNKPQNRSIWYPQGHKGWYIIPSMLHYHCLTSYTPKMAKEQVSDITYFLPATLTLRIMSSKDAATHVVANITQSLLNPTPTIPLKMLCNNQTLALKQLTEIFNMAAPPQVTPPKNERLQQYKLPKLPPRVNTSESTPEAAPGLPTRVDPQGDISFQPGQAPRRAPQCALHIIPYDMEPMPHAENQK